MLKERLVLRAGERIAGTPGFVAAKLLTPVALNVDPSLLIKETPGAHESKRVNKLNLAAFSLSQAAEIGALYFFLSRSVLTGSLVYACTRAGSLFSEFIFYQEREEERQRLSSTK